MLAIIPARGGSKGLPGKNIRMLKGKPLIAYTIEAALASQYITRVIVSTDDEEIAKISIQYGAECPFMRPKYLASDESLGIDAIKYTIEKIEENENLKIDRFIILQPTSPLRTTRDIDNSIELFNSKDADSVISYCKESHPIKWHKYIDAEGNFENIFEDKIKNRQDERPSYYPNGAIFIFKRKILLHNSYYTDRSFPYIMDRTKSVDIDDMDDFNYAEFLLGKNTNQ